MNDEYELYEDDDELYEYEFDDDEDIPGVTFKCVC